MPIDVIKATKDRKLLKHLIADVVFDDMAPCMSRRRSLILLDAVSAPLSQYVSRSVFMESDSSCKTVPESHSQTCYFLR